MRSYRLPDGLIKRLDAATQPQEWVFVPTATQLVIRGLELALAEETERRRRVGQQIPRAMVRVERDNVREAQAAKRKNRRPLPKG